MANVQQGTESIRVADKGSRQAGENLELAEGRYATGAGSIIELTDAQASLASTEANRVQALVNYRIAVATSSARRPVAWSDHRSHEHTVAPSDRSHDAAPPPAVGAAASRPRLRRAIWIGGAVVILIVAYRWWSGARRRGRGYLTARVDRGTIEQT